MYGGWHIVATIPNAFERGIVAPYDVYSPGPRGGLREDFYVQNGSFAAPRKHFTARDWVKRDTGGAAWRVRLFGIVNLPFPVLYVDPAYRYALFGERSRNLGWVYARGARIPDADYAVLLARFRDAGYDSSRLRKIVQTPDDIGRPGYWSDGITP